MTDILERVAIKIADANGDSWGNIPIARWHWKERRGEFGGEHRDISLPMQSDYLLMAEAALTEFRKIIAEAALAHSFVI